MSNETLADKLLQVHAVLSNYLNKKIDEEKIIRKDINVELSITQTVDDKYSSMFNKLIEMIMDRNATLGDIFNKNISFISYENEEAFDKDGTFTKTQLGQDKGIIVQFFDGNEPIYKYPPYGIEKEDFDVWYDKCIDDNKHLTWVRNTYWYLDKYSCSLVVRNKAWFDEITPLLKNIWNTIIKERETGYQHRAPKKREKRVVNVIKADNIKTDDKNKKNPVKKEKKPTMVIQVDI